MINIPVPKCPQCKIDMKSYFPLWSEAHAIRDDRQAFYFMCMNKCFNGRHFFLKSNVEAYIGIKRDAPTEHAGNKCVQ